MNQDMILINLDKRWEPVTISQDVIFINLDQSFLTERSDVTARELVTKRELSVSSNEGSTKSEYESLLYDWMVVIETEVLVLMKRVKMSFSNN